MYKNSLLDIISTTIPKKVFIDPSGWTTDKITFKKGQSKKPGPFSWDNSPYFKEIIDNFKPSDPTEFCAVQKPTQIGATQTILEPLIGYNIDIYPLPMIYATADKSMAEKNMNSRIDNIIASAGIGHKIKPITYKKQSRKTGDTKDTKEYDGGPLIALGAQNPTSARNFSAPWLLCDEVDAWPENTKHGDIIELFIGRTEAFLGSRKVLFLSSPLLSATSHIIRLVEIGDKRYYLVPCPRCGFLQALFWRGALIDNKYVNDEIKNIIFEVDGRGKLIHESVYYKCRECDGKILEHEKQNMSINGHWKATQKSDMPNFKSYLINNCYNLFSTWVKMAEKFIPAKKNPKKLMVFVNTQCGEGWDELVNSVSAKKVFNEKRRPYDTLIVPNKLATADGNGRILLLTCSVDVNKKDKWLAVEIMGHCLNGQTYIIAKGAIHGNYEPGGNLWQVMQYIEEYEYLSDDDIKYEIGITGVDCGFKREYVFSYTNSSAFAIPIRGVESIAGSKRSNIKDWDGNKVFEIDTKYYKINLFNSLNIPWAGHPNKQDNDFPNFPESEKIGGFEKMNLAEKFETFMSQEGFNKDFFLTYESERPIIIDLPNGDKGIKGFKKRIANKNHFLDCHVYNLALRDIYIKLTCKVMEIPMTDMHSMFVFYKNHLKDYGEPFLLENFIL